MGSAVSWSKVGYPPSGGRLASTLWLCEYWPEYSEALDGQHHGKLAMVCVNVVPTSPPISASAAGVSARASSVWSSVRMNTTLVSVPSGRPARRHSHVRVSTRRMVLLGRKRAVALTTASSPAQATALR